MKFILLLILPLILFSYGFPNIMDANGAIACSLTSLNEWIMKSASPKICERVNYWVHYECGRVPGMYLTDARCQPPAGFPLERLATSGSFMEISLDKSIYKMGNTIQVSGNAYTSVGLPEKNLGIKIINSDGHKIFEGKNTVDKAGNFGFNILTGTSISITNEGNYELVIVNNGKFGSTGVKKFTVSNDGLPIQIPTTQQSITATPSNPTTQNSMGSISSHTSPDSPIILHTEKKEYVMGESITLNGIVKFVNDKAVGVGLPRDLNVAIEVYDSKNSLIESHILKAKNDDTFVLTLVTGDNSKILKNGQYYFVAYYGLVNNKLLNSDYVGRYNVHVGENVLLSSSSNTGTNSPTNIVNVPTTFPTNPVVEPFTPNWSMIAGLLIVVAVVGGIIYKKIIGSGNNTSSTNYSDSGEKQDNDSNTRDEPHDHSKESKNPMYPTYADLKNNFKRFTWEDAEDLTALLFKAKGYSTKVGVPTKDEWKRKRNGDHGIDVRAEIDKTTTGIQVKHWESNVDEDSVIKTNGSSQIFDRVIIISTKKGFEKNAVIWANLPGNAEKMDLWDCDKFKEEIKKHLIEKDNSQFEETIINSDFNHYEILGANRTDTPEEIKQKYKELSLKLHPDKAKSALSENNMKQINEAYSILRDADKRRQYDLELDKKNA